MKAIRVHEVGGPEVMKLEDVPDPRPEPGRIVVRVKAAGVNPVDTYIRAGISYRKPDMPWTPGYDAGGIVESVGTGVNKFKPGDRVYTARTVSGAYGELVLCEENQLHRLPETVSFAQGAAVGVPYGAAHRSLYGRARAVNGETVLIHGASGGVGIAAVQIARAGGLKVIGTAGTKEGLALILKEGAHHAIDHREADYLKKIGDLSGGRGVDVILEMLANVNLSHDLDILALRGRVVVIGSRGTIEIDPRAAMAKDSSILGMSLMNGTADELAVIYSAVTAGLQDGTLRPIIARELPLAQAPEAHKAVMEPGSHGKIVLIP